MIRGSTYSAVMHLTILALILFGLPSLAFLLPKLEKHETPVPVVVMSDQDAADLSKTTKLSKEKGKSEAEKDKKSAPKKVKHPPTSRRVKTRPKTRTNRIPMRAHRNPTLKRPNRNKRILRRHPSRSPPKKPIAGFPSRRIPTPIQRARATRPRPGIPF